MGAVAVALSGGVDSAVAAFLLRRAGHRVIGLSLRLGRGPDRAPVQGARVAEQLGLEHRVIDAAQAFSQRVAEPSARTYAEGRTPNPCALCNAGVKLPLLWEVAAELGCRCLATGHYCGLRAAATGPRLVEAKDRAKSQAYFLARVRPGLLERLLFPLAQWDKDQVRRLAREQGLEAAEGPESQDACFLGPGGWDGLVAACGRPEPGVVVDRQGRVLGQHQGVHRFTIGQRRGLGLALGRPVYVSAIDGRRATVVVGPEEDLMARGLWGEGLRWYAGVPIDGRYQVRVRYNHRGVDCRVSLAGDKVKVEFAEPLRAVAPGQLAVFSRDHEIFGSAWIQRAIK